MEVCADELRKRLRLMFDGLLLGTSRNLALGDSSSVSRGVIRLEVEVV